MAWIIKLLSGSFLDKVLKHMENKANTETERLRINSVREANANAEAASVVKTGMEHKVFWIPWLLATVPTVIWYAWGMADSTLNGSLPDVSALPPQLKQYADIVWDNIFYAGGGVASASIIANAIRNKK